MKKKKRGKKGRGRGLVTMDSEVRKEETSVLLANGKRGGGEGVSFVLRGGSAIEGGNP